jgi:hypothetical protein
VPILKRCCGGCATDDALHLGRRAGFLPAFPDRQRLDRFEQDAADLFFQGVSSRYEHATLILTSNLPFARWGDVSRDQVAASDIIDRIAHHAEVIASKAPTTASNTCKSTRCRRQDRKIRPANQRQTD